MSPITCRNYPAPTLDEFMERVYIEARRPVTPPSDDEQCDKYIAQLQAIIATANAHLDEVQSNRAAGRTFKSIDGSAKQIALMKAINAPFYTDEMWDIIEELEA